MKALIKPPPEGLLNAWHFVKGSTQLMTTLRGRCYSSCHTHRENHAATGKLTHARLHRPLCYPRGPRCPQCSKVEPHLMSPEKGHQATLHRQQMAGPGAGMEWGQSPRLGRGASSVKDSCANVPCPGNCMLKMGKGVTLMCVLPPEGSHQQETEMTVGVCHHREGLLGMGCNSGPWAHMAQRSTETNSGKCVCT